MKDKNMRISIASRYLNPTIVLLYLIALILPAHVAAAADQQEFCGGENLFAVHAAQITSADQMVQIPNGAIDSAIYEANARQSLGALDMTRMVILGEFIVQLRQESQLVDAESVINEYSQTVNDVWLEQGAGAKEAYGGEIYDRLVHTMLEVAMDSQILKRYAPAVWGNILKKDGNLTLAGNAARHAVESAFRYPMHARIVKLFPQTLSKVRDCADKDPVVARTFDNTAGKKLGVSIKDSAKTIVRKRPALAAPPQILQLIEQNNTINLSLNELKAMSRTEFDKLHASIDDMQKTLVEIDAQQGVIIDYINDQQKQQAMQALAAAEAAEQQLSLDAFRASFSIVANLISFIDPEFGQNLSVAGDAAVQIADALNGWLTATSGLSALADVSSLSTIVMTGNVLGAVMNVINLFGDSGPSPDQMILEEIGKLRQEVNQLRTEMHDRFDRIDEELNQIYSTMQERFDLIDIQLGKINGKLDVIQESLVALDLRLSRLERNTFEMIDAVGRRPLLSAINGSLGYQKRTGLPMPYQPEFVEFENALHTWGAINAFDALAIGPSQRDYSPEALLTELNAYPMDANLNYLNGWLKVNGMPGISNKVVASPRDWMLAARAYTQLGSEWPEHMKRINPQRQAQLDAVGADIEMAMQNIAALVTMTGTVGNELLYTTVISYYQGRLARLNNAIQPLETTFVQEVQSKRLERIEPFNLYGGIDQPLAFQPPGLTMMTYGEEATLPAPANLEMQIPGLNRYVLAEYFAISQTQQIGVYMTGSVSNARSAPGCTPDPDVCPVIGDLKVFVRAAYGSIPLTQMELNAGRVTLPVIGGDVEDPTSYTVRNWANLKQRFERDATLAPLTPEQTAQRAKLYSDLVAPLEGRLAGYQQELYNRILTELNTGSLRQPAAELAGGKALVDQLVTIGLANAVSSDDFLHAMLYGNQHLVDDSQILQTYALSRTQPITGTALLVNPRLVLDQVADQRSAAFTNIVDGYLDAITAKTHRETLDHIASARRELELTMRIAQVKGEQPTTGAKRLFLPVINR
jgi:hypothetical protein